MAPLSPDTASPEADPRSCYFCGSPAVEIIRAPHLPEGVPVMECPSCAVVFFERSFQEEDYWNDGQAAVYAKPEIEESQRRDFEAKLARMASSGAKGGRLLDIGCGTGLFLETARGHGYDVYGLDISPMAAQIAGERLGPDRVQNAVAETCAFEDGFFDVITMWDVIEHLISPGPALAAVARLLKPGGLFVVLTPNERGLFKQGSLALYRMSLRRLRAPIRYNYYLAHCFSYSEESLQNVLGPLGFSTAATHFEGSNLAFVRGKLAHHYGGYIATKPLIAALPLLFRAADLMGQPNKIEAHFRKG